MRIASLASLALLGTVYALPTLILPWFGHIQLDSLLNGLSYSRLDGEKTIYQILKEDENFSRLVKAIDLNERVVEFLDDPAQSVTFFAVPNSGLPGHGRHDEKVDNVCHARPINDLEHLILQVEQLDHLSDTEDREKRKECLARLVHAVLSYHTLPEKYTSAQLHENSTFATKLTLKDGSFDHQPLRISVQSKILPPKLKVNFYAGVTQHDIEASNGVIHHITRPLLPPPSIFQEAFLFPRAFSFVTSAIQRVHLTGAVDRWYVPGEDHTHGSFHGATSTTFFAPTSAAFHRLPRKLQLFLFSPFGERALKKLLEFHIIPNFVLFSDYVHNATSEESTMTDLTIDPRAAQYHTNLPELPMAPLDDIMLEHHHKKHTPLPEPAYEYNVTLPTLLTNHSIHVNVARYESKLPLPGCLRSFTRFKVNGVAVVPFDVPARNGALQVIHRLLDPRKHHGRHGHGHHDHDHDREHLMEDEVDASWDDWEEWLPQWASEN
ncbi:FAS1 domain-containing protein [Pisolithus microcarpus]|nr:FAS1 domain-containing protein [Pisolithus microcarpus]